MNSYGNDNFSTYYLSNQIHEFNTIGTNESESTFKQALCFIQTPQK